jgi:Polyketide cyclase / dehydrase and lipid transport
VARSQWHKFYAASVDAPAERLFELLSDLPGYGEWLPGSQAYGHTTDVTPYPVRLGTRYHDGKPNETGKDWWGAVTGFQPPGSLDFQHTIHVRQLAATVDVRIHYSLEAADAGNGTLVTRWLVLDVAMPVVFRPLRPLITGAFDKENVRTMAALKRRAEAGPGGGGHSAEHAQPGSEAGAAS